MDIFFCVLFLTGLLLEKMLEDHTAEIVCIELVDFNITLSFLVLVG